MKATQVAPVIFVTELVVPLGLGVTVGGESWGDRPLALCAISAGLASLTIGVVALMRSSAVSGLLAGHDQVALP